MLQPGSTVITGKANSMPYMYMYFTNRAMYLHNGDTITERQKKLITSSEQCSLKSTASKLIIFGHR